MLAVIRRSAVAILTITLFACDVPLAAAGTSDVTFLNIGTAGIGGGYYPAGGAICNMVNKTRSQLGHRIRCTVESTAGSVSNLRALRTGDLEIGFAQSDMQYYAYHGTNVFQADGPNPDLRFLFSLQFDAIHVVTNPKLDIKSFRDLKGKIVNTGNVGSGHEITFKDLFANYYKIDPTTFFAKEAKLTTREQAEALCDGKIDAYLLPAVLRASSPVEATSTCKARIVPWYDDAIEKLLKDNPHLAKVVIPAGTYAGQSQDVPTWGVGLTILATTRTSDDIAYAITKSVFDNWETFEKQSAVFEGVKRSGAAVNGRVAPYHPGSLKYFKETGLVK